MVFRFCNYSADITAVIGNATDVIIFYVCLISLILLSEESASVADELAEYYSTFLLRDHSGDCCRKPSIPLLYLWTGRQRWPVLIKLLFTSEVALHAFRTAGHTHTCKQRLLSFMPAGVLTTPPPAMPHHLFLCVLADAKDSKHHD